MTRRGGDVIARTDLPLMGDLENPNGDSALAGDSALVPGETTTRPGESTLRPGGITLLPGESSTRPGESTLRLGDIIPLPGERVLVLGETSTRPESAQVGESALVGESVLLGDSALVGDKTTTGDLGRGIMEGFCARGIGDCERPRERERGCERARCDVRTTAPFGAWVICNH